MKSVFENESKSESSNAVSQLSLNFLLLKLVGIPIENAGQKVKLNTFFIILTVN